MWLLHPIHSNSGGLEIYSRVLVIIKKSLKLPEVRNQSGQCNCLFTYENMVYIYNVSNVIITVGL